MMTDNFTTTSINTYDYCTHRLPCGYCQILCRVCPMQGNTVIGPTWKLPNTVTCKTSQITAYNSATANTNLSTPTNE